MTWCPFCNREIPESGVYWAIQKEKYIWRPWDSPYPDHTGYPQDTTTWNPDSTTLNTDNNPGDYGYVNNPDMTWHDK